MADNPLCKIDGCGKGAKTRGWCQNHYSRWRRHGDPLGGRTAQGETHRYFHEVVLTDARGPDDPCLIWPFHGFGLTYPRIWLEGRSRIVSRLVCEERHGPPPTPKHHAAHSCGKGKQGCVTKSHLDWKTPKANKADELTHGTRLRGSRQNGAKLTDEEAASIKRRLSDGEMVTVLAREYGVSQPAISMIKAGKNWPGIHPEVMT